MRQKQLVSFCVLGIALLVIGTAGAQQAMVDGVPYTGEDPIPEVFESPWGATSAGDRAPVVDVVGDTSSGSSGTALAKGNAYRIDTSTGLVEAEFWLDFNDVQTVAFYLYHSTVEFGTYTQVWTTSTGIAGGGAAWYSSGPINYRMEAGEYYIIAVSWSGTTGYSFGSGDTQATSFGAQVYGYATGTHPLPGSFVTSTNDMAIYHQRLTTDVDVPVELQAFSVE